jgi:predicted nucleic acid-binding protein
VIVPAFDLTAELASIGKLMVRYEDLPMSLADACLVRMAEMHASARVFTLDADFRVYRRNRRAAIPLLSPWDDNPRS